MIEPDVVKLERRVSELDRAVLGECFVGQHGVRIFERGEPVLRMLVRDEFRAGVLERLAARDVIVVMMAVDHVLDRLLRDLFDLREISRRRFAMCVRDRVRRDHGLTLALVPLL